MNKEEKVKVVEELKGQLNDYKSIYLTDIAGLDAMQTSKLRRECFNSNVKLSTSKLVNPFISVLVAPSATASDPIVIELLANETAPLDTLKECRKHSKTCLKAIS